MKYINMFREGMHVSEVYLCKNKQIQLTKTGKEYGNLVLQDKTGTIDGKIWDLSSPGVGNFEAMDYVYGYTCGNDVSTRDLQFARGNQWVLSKSLEGFGPIGPWIETELDPAAGLDISSWVNGQRRQHSNTRNLIFDVPFLVSYLSQAMTLEPGDVIFTGTPSGVGPVKPGDVMEMRIQGIGSLRSPVEAEG